MARVVWKVLTEGILLPDLETSAVYYDEFYDLDTSNDYDTFEAATPSGGTIAISTEGFWRFSQAFKYGGGILKMAFVNASDNTDSLHNIQKIGSVVYIDSIGKNIEFESRFIPNDTTNIGYIFGLFPPDADSVRNGENNDGIFFEKPYGTNTLYFRSYRNGTTTSRTMSAVTLNDTAFISLKFVVTDTNLATPYVNGKADSLITSNIPFDLILVPTVEVVADTMAIDYLSAKQVDKRVRKDGVISAN